MFILDFIKIQIYFSAKNFKFFHLEEQISMLKNNHILRFSVSDVNKLLLKFEVNLEWSSYPKLI